MLNHLARGYQMFALRINFIGFCAFLTNLARANFALVFCALILSCCPASNLMELTSIEVDCVSLEQIQLLCYAYDVAKYLSGSFAVNV